MRKIFLTILLLTFSIPGNVLAEVYKWIDEHGKIHYSDKKPEVDSEVLVPPPINEMVSTNDHAESDAKGYYKKDDFIMPFRKSDLPYTFTLTSALNKQKPVDSLASINLKDRDSFSFYVNIHSLKLNTDYEYHVRILDAKGELVNSKIAIHKNEDKNNMYIVGTIHPLKNLHKPGNWTFKCVINDESLFVEKRGILF